MGRVLTNASSLRAAIEASPGVLPGSPLWHVVEFDNIGAYGATITTTPRRPVRLLRGRQKGTPTDLDSVVEFETDLTWSAIALFGEGFFFAEWANVEFNLRNGTGAPTVVGGSPTGYTISAASALLAGKVQQAAGGVATLVWAAGYLNAANNGMKALTADLATSGTVVTVSGLVTETSPPANASVHVAGVRTVNDLTVTVALDGTGSIVSAADITDFTALGVFPGMLLHVGGVDTDRTVLNAPTIGAAPAFGYVRVRTSAGGTVTFDKATPTLLAGGAGSSSGSETVDLLFGQFARNVTGESNANDTRFLERSYHFEVAYPGLGSGGATEYEYAGGNYCSDLTIDLPLTGKATMSFGFLGTTTDPITATRKTNAAAAVSPLRTAAYSTAIDLVSITTDVVSAVSDVCFKSMSLNVVNNAAAEKCLGTLGARFVNFGLFQFDIEGQMLFTNKAIVNAVRDNTTVTLATILRNQDGAIGFDVPELTLSGGGREFPVDQSVLVNLTGASHTSSFFGFDASLSILPVVPLAA